MPPKNLKQKPFIFLDEIARAGVLVREPHQILPYLAAHPDTSSLLASLCGTAREKLPNDAQLSLEFYRDRESDDAYPTLYVRQEEYSPDILDRLDAISAEFETRLADSSGWALLTTDFHSPR